jgi:hypothetical protein
MKQETLEEAFKLFKEKYPILTSYNLHHLLQVTRFGAKWQQEQDKNKFSEEEVKNIVYDFWNHTLEESVYDTNMNLYFEKWFKQFKNK